MFRVRIPAFETYRNATRPIILKSIESVQDTFNLDKNITTFFGGEAESSRMIGTTMSGEIRTNQKTDFGFDDRQYVEWEMEDAEANSELDSSHRLIVNKPVWRDPITGSMIIPNYVTRKITVTLNRYCKDRVTAQRERNRINSILKEPRTDWFSVSLHYPINYSIMECMETIYNRLVKANVIDETKINALEWFKTNCNVPHDIIANLMGNNPCFVFKRSVDTIRLQFDGIDIAKSITKGKYYGQYLMIYQYSFYYSELVEWELHYPIMVYQQLTDDIYIPQFKKEYLNDFPEELFFEGQVGKNNNRYHYWTSPGMYVFPKEDYFRLPLQNFLDQKLQRLAVLDDVDEQVVLNIFKFGGEEKFWNSKFKYFIKTYASKITKRHQTPLYLTLWSDNVQVLDDQIELLDNGDLILKRKPTMSASYRVVLYFDYDISSYNDDFVNDITSCEYEDMGRWLLGVLFPYLPLPGDKEYTGITKEGSCPWLDWNDDVINKVNPLPHYPNGIDDGKGPPIYVSEALLIAKNEHTQLPKPYSLLDYTASEYLRRK